MAISDFILARTTEEEQLAHAALDGRAADVPWNSGTERDHHSRWNPWRVESACIARRLLVRAHGNAGPVLVPGIGEHRTMLAASCRTCRDEHGPSPWPCYTLKVLASEWSHHPDYNEAWRPTRNAVAQPVPAAGLPPLSDRPRPPGQRDA